MSESRTCIGVGCWFYIMMNLGKMKGLILQNGEFGEDEEDNERIVF